MSEVNWDDEVYKAENSPRSVLAAALADCDQMRAVIVVSVSSDTVHDDTFRVDSSGGRFELMGALQCASDWFRNGCPPLEEDD